LSGIVPFGKYKGQPVEVLIGDVEYCEWLASQPWFRDRFAAIHQVIINYGQQPTETPEHNEMQAWFLDDAVCRRAALAICPEAFDAAQYPPHQPPLERDAEICDRRFEEAGWDVAYRMGWENFLVECKPLLGDDYPAVLRQVLPRQTHGWRAVVVRRYQFERVGWEQVREIFRGSLIRLIHMPSPDVIVP
jgi:hypothetical protein